MVLAGDIGGTKVVLGLFNGTRLIETARFPSGSGGEQGLETLCASFLARHPPQAAVAAAAFGIAGPIVGGRVKTTNLPWVVEQEALERLLRCPVLLLNDLEAMGHGLEALKADDLVTINQGQPVPGAPRALIAAGTGLGQAYLVHEAAAGRYVPCASEGGHTDFGARTDDEISLMVALRSRYGRVSAERVVSGPGIVDIFTWMESTKRHDEAPRELREAMAAGDPPAEISKAAMAGGPPLCVETMRLFVSAYGAEAGNLALKVMGLGGVYVAGGIAPKILPLLTAGGFLQAFLDKGRFAGLMRRMPLRVVLNQNLALLGAARAAARLAAAGTPGAP